MEKTKTSTTIVECAILIAMAFALSFIKIIKALNLKYKSIELLRHYKWRLRKACWVKLTSFFLTGKFY